MNRDYAELINLAAEMARGLNMPLCSYEDNGFYASTPKAERKRLTALAERADRQSKDWAVRVRAVADRLSRSAGATQEKSL